MELRAKKWVSDETVKAQEAKPRARIQQEPALMRIRPRHRLFDPIMTTRAETAFLDYDLTIEHRAEARYAGGMT